LKHPMHWASLADVVDAMSRADPSSTLPGGFMKFSKSLIPECAIKPLHVPQVSRTAGKQLSGALMDALECHSSSVLPEKASRASWVERAMCRWLRAASLAEPQVLRRLLQAGNSSSLEELVGRFRNFPLYQELQSSYVSLLELGLAGDFPPLRFSESSPGEASCPTETELSLHTCGEFWVLLLLLAPQHIRAAVAEELGDKGLSRDFAKSVRGPWALPLEASREALCGIFQDSAPQQCA